MNLQAEQSPEIVHTAPPPRTAWILMLALAQGLAVWVIPKDLLFALLPPLVTAPLVFDVSERYLARRPWLPSLLVGLFWLPGLCYGVFVVGMANAWDLLMPNAVVYWAFCFVSLPFIQTYAELGLRGLRAAELSTRMNRNITLGLIGCLAFMPVCLALGIGIGNIDWNAVPDMGRGENWNRSTPYFLFSLVVPLTFAGAVNWAQISMEKQAGTGMEWPVLPFLRKMLGVISGWVALVAGIAMACIMLSFFVLGSEDSASSGTDLLRLMPAAVFWTTCSMSVREGRWEDRPRFFRGILTLCTLVFPLYMLWCAFMQWGRELAPETSFYTQQHAFWTWQSLSLGILLMASLGHGMAVCCRRWPAWASSVNVGVHLCLLLLLLVTRLPFADPLRYEAEAKVRWLVANPHSRYFSRLEREFGRYGQEALRRALEQQGVDLGGQEGTAESRLHTAWENLLTRSRQQAYDDKLVEIRVAFAAMPRLPHDAVIPESFFDWLATLEAFDYDARLRYGPGHALLLQDMNRDGEAEIILLDLRHGTGEVLVRDGEKGWTQAAPLYFDMNIEALFSVTTAPPLWDDLVINGHRIRLK